MRIIGLGLLLLLLIPTSSGQLRLGRPQREPRPLSSPLDFNERGEFTFARTIYHSGYGGWRGGSWAVDFPEADYHFIQGLRDWSGTNLKVSARPQQVPIMHENIFQYPLLYIVEPGHMELSDEEAKRLREYLERGGFLFLDDFWGEYEWRNVQEQMRKVVPEYEIKDLPPDHTIFHCYLDIDEVVQVPGIGSWLGRGVTHEKGGVMPHYMGIEDKTGRLIAFIARNCDLGDAWEWIDDPRYPVKYGLAAYKVGVNVIIYAMTH